MTRKTWFFHRNHMLDTLDFTGSELLSVSLRAQPWYCLNDIPPIRPVQHSYDQNKLQDEEESILGWIWISLETKQRISLSPLSDFPSTLTYNELDSFSSDWLTFPSLPFYSMLSIRSYFAQPKNQLVLGNQMGLFLDLFLSFFFVPAKFLSLYLLV